MVNGKKKYAFWLSPETKELAASCYREDNCKSQSEYIEKAILFYTAYLHTQNTSEFLPRVLADTLEGVLQVFGDRIGKLMNKLSVEQNISNHILAADTQMDVSTYDRMRSRSLREVRETNGQISFRDALIFQKSV